MTTRQACLAAVFGAALGLGIAAPAPAQQGVPGQPGIASQPPMANQGQNQPAMRNQDGTQGITIQPGQENRPGQLAQPGTQDPARQLGTGGSIAPNQGGNPGAAGAATGATTPGQPTQGAGRTDSGTPPAVTTQHTEPRSANAPVAGANSFTEGQARARIGDAGFTDVQGLELDNQGIWRGRAMRNGQQTGVALDFQGNVVATQR